MGRPTFSVIVTAYNEESLVGCAIRSVLRQTRKDLELLVIDDGSTDATADVVKEFESDPRVRLIRQRNMGLSAARNTGIEAASADLISFLDSDDLFMPRFLEETHAALEESDAAFAYTDAWWYDDDRGRFYSRSAMAANNPPGDPPADPHAFLRLLMRRNFILVYTTVRREAFAACGDFDTSLRACEDYDLWIRFLSNGFPAVLAGGGLLAIKTDRGTQMTSEYANMGHNLLRVYTMAAERPDAPDDIRQLARERAESTKRELTAMERRSPGSLVWRARLAVATARRRSPRSRIWRSDTPPEVAAAFPDGIRSERRTA